MNICNTVNYMKILINIWKKYKLNYIRNTLNDIANQHIINDFNQIFILALINMFKTFTDIIKDLS